MPKKIEVVAKITAGVHRVHGPIVEGRKYWIFEEQFAPQLFDRVVDEDLVVGQVETDQKPQRKKSK